MIIVLSPTKTFRNYERSELLFYMPLANESQSQQLIERLKAYSIEELCQLMKISHELGASNYDRFHQFNEPEVKGYHAVDYYYGEAFKALDSLTMTKEGRCYMAEKLKILSGLYGCLNAMDIIKAYRLEMGMRFTKHKEDQLYTIWQEVITKQLEEALQMDPDEQVLINLASEEYSKAINLTAISQKYPVRTLHFKVKKGDSYKVIGMYAKKARGLMTRYICENQLKSSQLTKAFDWEGYQYDEALSCETDWVFVKK